MYTPSHPWDAATRIDAQDTQERVIKAQTHLQLGTFCELLAITSTRILKIPLCIFMFEELVYINASLQLFAKD